MRWPHYEHIFFDCDSTLTTVEGIDVLAETAGKGWRVEVLTQAAMDGHLDLEEVYRKRLQAVKPTRQQVQEIRRFYKRNVVTDAAITIKILQEQGHAVYIISGGLAEPVTEFGLFLGVPREHIRAVDLEYNELAGNWWQPGQDNARYIDYHEGALTVSDGKAQIVREFLHNKTGRSLLVGDGHSDLLAGTAVDLFVGFGGVITREHVLAQAPAFIHSPSLAPLLALAMGPASLRLLQDSPYHKTVANVFTQIQTGAITFQDERLKTKFQQAIHATHPPLHPWPY
ncbi:MAG: HAD-IB family phosphatase [Anaerolinea sp.]|nr:HAD-IB family phosphatase [Anaerolinea sp.]